MSLLRFEVTVTTVVISPDFFSHYQPLAVIATALHRSGERVIVATGLAMRPLVERDGLEWRRLDLAAGSNDGLAAAATHDPSDPNSLDAFIDATRRGFVETLSFQATKRGRELLWNPVDVGRNIMALLDDINPDQILADQVSLVSTLGVLASGRRFTTIVPGHPTQLPIAGEHYGNASSWPDTLHADPAELAALTSTITTVNAEVTESFNQALRRLTTNVAAVDDAFAVHGEHVAYHWETDLHDPARLGRLPEPHLDLGPLVRHELLPPEFDHVMAGDRPLVVIALGTFLVHRHDVLTAAMRAVDRVGARAVVAIGHHEPATFGPIPHDWILARRIPQVALLRHAHCIINHAGNGSVQEALAAGTHQILLPMSTDQIAIAADLVRTDRATAADPNHLNIDDLANQLANTITKDRSTPTPTNLDTFINQTA
ncbi:MAG TPA: nucleotide disphospho-sugar-binding domain-containing protein [Ilumatobacteraceae bacterium]|nr:nucleotide disphospho-sugar-binding domain-containing protein [Ilumatobacteraceae bacterium]